MPLFTVIHKWEPGTGLSPWHPEDMQLRYFFDELRNMFFISLMFYLIYAIFLVPPCVPPPFCPAEFGLLAYDRVEGAVNLNG